MTTQLTDAKVVTSCTEKAGFCRCGLPEAHQSKHRCTHGFEWHTSWVSLETRHAKATGGQP